MAVSTTRMPDGRAARSGPHQALVLRGWRKGSMRGSPALPVRHLRTRTSMKSRCARTRSRYSRADRQSWGCDPFGITALFVEPLFGVSAYWTDWHLDKAGLQTEVRKGL